MYECMLKSENSKLSMLVTMSQDDYRCILGRNVRQICATWNISEIELWQKWKLGRLSVFNTDEMKECEWVIEMIQELSVGVNSYNESEIAAFFGSIPRFAVWKGQ